MQIQYPTGTGMPVVPQSTHLPPPPPISGDGGLMQSLKPTYSAQNQISPIGTPMNVTQPNVSGSGGGANTKSAQEQRVKRPMNAFMVRA